MLIVVWPPDLYDHRSPCVHGSSGAEALVADRGEEDGHGGELRTGDPAFVGYRERENDKEDGYDEIEIRLQVVPAEVGLCLLHIQPRLKTRQ